MQQLSSSIPGADLDTLLTPEEFAAWAQITPRMAVEYARKGKVPALKLGGEWRFHPRTVLAKQSQSQ